MKAYVYALIDPLTKQIRYIGKTKCTVHERMLQHCGGARNGNDSHRSYWIRSLLLQGLISEVICLEECSDESSCMERERFWIEHHTALGAKLCNHTKGGDGILGHSHSEEARRKIREYQLRPEVIELNRKRAYEMKINGNGYHFGSPKITENIQKPKKPRGNQKGCVVTLEQRAKISATLKGRKIPRDIVERIAAKRRGVKTGPHSESTCKAISRGKLAKTAERTKIMLRLVMINPQFASHAFAYIWKYYVSFMYDMVDARSKFFGKPKRIRLQRSIE